jgi:hypothetical protein
VIDMRTSWLALISAATAFPAAAAAATFGLTTGAPTAKGVRVHRGDDGQRWRDDRTGDERRDWRGYRGRDVYVQDYYGGNWARYNNPSWEADSYHDWWHERPERSLPRWMQRNGNCQRIWWSGGGWTC